MEGLSGEGYLLLAVVMASQLAQGRSAEEIGFLSAFFNVLGDNLALLALGVPSSEDNSASGE